MTLPITGCFPPICRSGADYTDIVATFGMCDHQYSRPGGHAHQNITIFILRMVRVMDDPGKRIAKTRGGFSERYSMLTGMPGRFFEAPLEGNGHVLTSRKNQAAGLFGLDV